MTTLARDADRTMEIGNINQHAMIAADIIYGCAAVGLVDGTGYARPLVGGDRFVGFAEKRVDNAAGAAADKDVRLIESGKVVLSVAGAVITDVGQPVYATDDDTFVFNPVGASFIGRVHRFISAGLVLVHFDVHEMVDPWGGYSVRETLTGTKTFDAEDCGKLFVVTSAADGAALTLPAIATGLSGLTILAIDAFGTTQVKIDPNAADMILGPDITGADNKDLLLTKATQRRGDFVELIAGDADGYMVTKLRGTWVREA